MRIKIAEYSVAYTLGALGYCIIEILWRGYSHWSMTVTGGICFMIIYLINDSFENESVWIKSIISAIAVTAIEFIVGCVVNLVLGWNVWDYSDRTMSLMGQICPEYFILWYMLSVPSIMIAEEIKCRIFGCLRKTA